MDVKHDYIAEIQTRQEDDASTVEARKSILAENDTDAQHQAEEWVGQITVAHTRATHLIIRHDDRVVVDRELKRKTS